MKKTYPIVMLALLMTTLFACKKNKDHNDDLKKELVSIWELAETSSAMGPMKTYGPGNGNTLSINNDDTYAYYKDETVMMEHGNYTIVPDTSVEKEVCLVNLKDKYKNRFEITNVTPIPTVMAFKTFFYVEGDKLYMIGGCYAYDAGSLRVYRRANPIAID
jgi:hypothetical protein